MRKIMALGLAGALATASVGATTQNAEAGGFVAGLVVGVGAVVLLHHLHPRFAQAHGTALYSYAPGYGDDHVTWCKTHYRSYSIATDTFRGYDGFDHKCVSPH